MKKIISTNITEDCGHGRVEVRQCDLITDLEFIDDVKNWKEMKTLVRIKSNTYRKKLEKETTSIRYYISSLKADAELHNKSIRSHWIIENNLHWNLDVIFNEDNQAKRNQNAVENSNLLAKIAIKLLDDEQTLKKAKNRKRQKAFANDTYRELVMKV